MHCIDRNWRHDPRMRYSSVIHFKSDPEFFQLSYSYIVESIPFDQMKKILIYCASTIATIVIITTGIFLGTQVSGYNPDNIQNPVDRKTCTCNCWDGFYRGPYGRGGYKTFYINYEQQTVVLLGLFLFCAELLRHFLIKLFIHRRFSLVLLLPAIYANFYGIWCIINYVNDHEYSRLLPSQVFFSITELITTYIFYRCLLLTKDDPPIQASSVYLVATICSLHILLALGQLNISLIFRNIGLLTPDFIGLFWAIFLMIKKPPLRPYILDGYIWFTVGLFLFLFYIVVCPFVE